MPFFCMDVPGSFTVPDRSCVLSTTKKIIIATLQVRIPPKDRKYRKRASVSAPAGMTAEAALVLPLFLFAGVIMMMPMRILDTERQIQAIVTSVGEDISQMAYLAAEGTEIRDRFRGTAWEKDGEEGGYAPDPEVWTARTERTAAWAYAEGALRWKTRELPVSWLSLIHSELLEDGETVDLVVDYRIKLPFSVFGLGSVKRTSRCYLRAWIGSDGQDDDQPEEEEDDPIVYVGKGSTRYHLSPSCHYLDNRLTAVAAAEIGRYRNAGGSRYTPCVRCADPDAATVYIMQAGERYHSSKNCSAIQAYVSAVRKSEVEHLGACSYCGGDRG